MSDLDLDPEHRRRLVERISTVLETAVPASTTTLCGSLAAGSADAYSDIDLVWAVPDAAFATAVARTGGILGTVGPVAAVRADPDLARSERRRLLFVRFAELPLFWRLDLDVRSASVAHDDDYDAGNIAAAGTDGWERPTSALTNAIAAIKAVRRGASDRARYLVARGFDRIGLTPDTRPLLPDAIAALAEACAEQDPGLRDLADRVRRLVEVLLRDHQPSSKRDGSGLVEVDGDGAHPHAADSGG